MTGQAQPGGPPRRPDLTAAGRGLRSPGALARRRRPGVGSVVRRTVLIFVGIGIGRYLPRHEKPLPLSPLAGAEATVPEVATGDSVEQATLEGIRKRQLARVRSERSQLIILAAEVGSALESSDREAREWKSITESVLSGEPGRKIVLSRDLVARYQAVNQQPLPQVRSAARARAVLGEVIPQLKRAQANPLDASAVPGDVGPGLEQSLKEAQDAERAWARLKAELQSVIADGEAAARGKPDAAGQQTLEEALRALTLDEARKRIATANDADALVGKRRLLVSREGRLITTAYFEAFVSPGYAQPTDKPFDLRKEGTKTPVSLSRLRTSGALTYTPSGLAALLFIATSGDNDRPHWAIRPLADVDQLTTQEQVFVQTAQALFNELGDAMVEEGLLSK